MFIDYVDQLLLFGSKARHDHVERADIDLAIACHGATDRQWLEVLDIIEDADTLLKIDCVRLDTLPQESELLANIRKDAVVLYEKTRS